MSVAGASCGDPPLGAGDAGPARDAVVEEHAPELEASAEHPDGCAADAQCAAPAGALGSGCASDAECASGHCTGGACCSAASCPTCQACGGDGTCAPAKGAPCTTPHASASACDGAGVCTATECEPGYLHCEGGPSDGCETAFGLPNCGGCGVLCSPGHVTVAVCSASSAGCTYAACSPGYLDCDGSKANGCETPFGLSNCAACGILCQPAHAVGAACSATTGCGYAACAPSDAAGHLYLDCDGDVTNGCESDPSSDATCGSCGTQCGPRSACGLDSTGAYTCVHQND